MTIYRVGSQGATVFDAEGKSVARLRPGQVVVEGTIDTAESSARQYADAERKRRAEYADKRLRPMEDKGL